MTLVVSDCQTHQPPSPCPKDSTKARTIAAIPPTTSHGIGDEFLAAVLTGRS
ncbi:hypothetical protein [Streptomyces sp. NPDC058657]|uniref:hypothetical protein n=1 Tax=unclassified Streptomyces TaxID=2593676 RepID=UPI0036633025